MQGPARASKSPPCKTMTSILENNPVSQAFRNQVDVRASEAEPSATEAVYLSWGSPGGSSGTALVLDDAQSTVKEETIQAPRQLCSSRVGTSTVDSLPTGHDVDSPTKRIHNLAASASRDAAEIDGYLGEIYGIVKALEHFACKMKSKARKKDAINAAPKV